MPEQNSIGPIDGSAAHLLEGATCAWLDCQTPPVTHRRMKVSLPIRSGDGEGRVVNAEVQEVDAAFCAPHNEMLDAGKSVSISEQSGSL